MNYAIYVSVLVLGLFYGVIRIADFVDFFGNTI